MNALPKNKKDLTQAEIADSMSTVLRYLGDSEPMAGVQNHGQMLIRREELLMQVAETEAKIESNAKGAASKAKALLWAGSAVGFAQFAFIFYGTFHVYSWDIMEPITACVSLSDAIAGYMFWLWTGKPWDLDSLRTHYYEKALAKSFATSHNTQIFPVSEFVSHISEIAN